MELQFKFNDGGRSKYFKGETGDCVNFITLLILIL